MHGCWSLLQDLMPCAAQVVFLFLHKWVISLLFTIFSLLFAFHFPSSFHSVPSTSPPPLSPHLSLVSLPPPPSASLSRSLPLLLPLRSSRCCHANFPGDSVVMDTERQGRSADVWCRSGMCTNRSPVCALFLHRGLFFFFLCDPSGSGSPHVLPLFSFFYLHSSIDLLTSFLFFFHPPPTAAAVVAI